MKVGSSYAKCPSFVCRHGCDALLNMEVRKRIVRVEVAVIRGTMGRASTPPVVVVVVVAVVVVVVVLVVIVVVVVAANRASRRLVLTSVFLRFWAFWAFCCCAGGWVGGWVGG